MSTENQSVTDLFNEISVLKSDVEPVISGGSGGDFLVGGAGNDTIFGLGANDYLSGGYGANDDVLVGGEGRDTFAGELGDGYGFGNDTVADFGADDNNLSVLNYGSAPVTIDLSFDGTNSYLTFAQGTDAESTFTLENYLVDSGAITGAIFPGAEFNLTSFADGVVSDDIIIGTLSNESLFGYAGNDELIANNGLDYLFGGAGNDTLLGSNAGNDRLFGEAGNDQLVGGHARDFLDGGQGNDVLSGRGGDDRFEFVQGQDDYGARGWGFGHDTVTDFDGEDLLTVFNYGVEPVTVSASFTGTDTILTFSEGTALESSVTLENYFVDPYQLPVGGAFDFEFSFQGHQSGIVSNDVLLSTAANGFVVTAAAGDDTVYGSSSADFLYGDQGDDELFGGNGTDVLSGGLGDDYLQGDAGADFFDFEIFGSGGHEIGFGSDVIGDFEAGDQVSIYLVDLISVGVDLSQDGADSVLTVGTGTAYESQIRFQDYALDANDIEVQNGLISIQGQEDYLF
ncbi:hypothetical protein GFB49_13705 [Epibacterium sp. SM1979]|uniref:Bifunctional hemolysin/adenylate cyclase n=1 Tax=Tritonibacter litoralis TaxID=2662264 RepID=A0A843YK23_9RHOB|nr:calcium-binding protein [Tritonibacter litoralis]MQQ09519.1 hypothetical protein [Tritonibacter litoralis]